EAVEDGVAEPERYLPAMREQVQALGTLVDDLFELARIDAGALTIESQDAPISALVQACLRGLEPQAQAKGVTLEARLDGDPVARCAPDKVERVLLNLLTNALRHTPSDGAIAVSVRSEAHTVEIAVEDSGSGIEPGNEARIFDRFWRADTSRSSDGAGLGLAIAQG